MTVPRFWREIPQRYMLQASKCGNCEAIQFPPRVVCPTCRRQSIDKMTPVTLSGKGTVLEATRVHRPARGYERLVPYILALVQTDEGPMLTGQVVDIQHIPRPGAVVVAVFRKLGEDGASGVIHYGTKWRLAEAGGMDEEE